ncbi:MAG: type II toxin-antitoxin system RatA family toxin [Burkholderiaceae bacterium]
MSENRIDQSALLPYSCAQMYALVDAIEQYPDFLPWCSGAQVDRRDPTNVVATIQVAFKGLSTSFTTRNEHVAPRSITMALLDGPFTALDGGWRFEPLAEDACKVHFALRYSMRGGLLGRALKPLFATIVGSMVDAFTREAARRYD